jgi:hypothetical protein
MTRVPDLDELVGQLDPSERERLLRTHELLVEAGPPPELPPHLEAGPTLAMTLGGPRRRRLVQRRVALLAAAVVVLLLAFLGGYIAGNDRTASGHVLQLHGTAAAPLARGSLRIGHVDEAGNWPMTLAALGLPKLPPKSYYEVFLTRHGKIFAPCGSFVVKDANVAVSVRLNAPYRLQAGDGWVVTRQAAQDHTVGPVVLSPLT